MTRSSSNVTPIVSNDTEPRLSSEERRDAEKPIRLRLVCRTPVGEKTCGAFLAAVHVTGTAVVEMICSKCHKASAFRWTADGVIRQEATLPVDAILRELGSKK